MEENKEKLTGCDGNEEIPVEEECTEQEMEKDCGNENEDENEGVDIEALIAEAEQRGYLRGRNERIEQLMDEPGLLERDGNGAPGETESEKVEILRHRRISIWDL